MNEETLFHLACEKPLDERAAFLDEACADDTALRQRLEILLAAHEHPGSFLQSAARDNGNGEPAPNMGRTVLQSGVQEGPGTVIGPYKLLQQIGEGGMGVVFMAEQSQPVRRTVALKIIKPGMDSRQVIARFEAERQAIALMDHPNIARVLDAGTTDSGRPYFVMELVKGVPITEYCDKHKLTPGQRLELFVQVCHAVQHAHQKGIIHRDLKPSNVLIAQYDGKPVPKVIDFGVAKATGQQLTERTMFTGFGDVIGTPEYMSPEQAELNQLDIDTRSDIYSLGVLLYELLTGTTPIEHKRVMKAGLLEMLRVVREEEPPRPSMRLSTSEQLPSIAANRGVEPKKLSGLVHGELDWIVMKSLEKDRARRYETANGLAADIQRHLTDEPILAGPPSRTYRLRKFARKNRKLLAAAAVFVALLVITTLAAMSAAVQSARLAEKEHEFRSTAERRADEERKAKEELEGNLYLHRIARAQQELLAENTGRAEELLDECPAHLRSWEWHYLKRRRPGNPLTLQGNISAAFSSDGRYLALRTGIEVGRIDVDIIDSATGRRIRTLHEVTRAIESCGMAFYPKAGETILAAADFRDKVVRLWNVDTGQEIRTLGGHGDRLRTVAFSPDGQQLAAGSIERGARVWDWKTGQLMFELSKPPLVSRIAYSPDGRRVAVGVWGHETDVIIYDSASGREIRSFGKHNGGIEGLAYSPSGEHVATSGSDGMVKIWNEGTGALHLTLSGHTGTVKDVAYTPDGRRIASAGWDKTVKIWDAETGRETLTLRGHTDEVFKVAFSPDGHLLVSAGLDSVKVWNATPVGEITGSEALSVPGHSSFVTSVAFSPDGRLLASAGSDGLIKVWEVASLGQGTELKGLTLEGHTDRVLSLAFSPDSRRLASAGWDADLKIWDTACARELLTVPAGDEVRNVAFSPDGRRLASFGPGGLKVWNAETGAQLMAIRIPEGDLYGLAYSPDGKYVALGRGGTVRIWNMETAKEVRSFNHSGLVWSVAYSPDGQRVASASFDQTLKIWDSNTGKEIRTLRGHADRVVSVAFSPDGKRLASGSADSTVKVWDAASGQEISTLRGHTGYVWGVAFSPDGKRLASAGGHHAKGEVKVWDLTRLGATSDPAAQTGQKAVEPAPK